jgi:hypothetical protein
MTAAEAVRAGIEADISRLATVERLDGAPVNVNANLLAAQERDRAAREKAAREAQFGGQVSESFKFVPGRKGGYYGPNLDKVDALLRERAAIVGANTSIASTRGPRLVSSFCRCRAKALSTAARPLPNGKNGTGRTSR